MQLWKANKFFLQTFTERIVAEVFKN